jgi:hypothetical protein
VDNLCREHEITLDRIFNADQFGLFYKRLPSRVIVRKENRAKTRGSKRFKCKERVTMMIMTSPTRRGPLAMVSKHNRPRCFEHYLGSKEKPFPYIAQKSAWFDGRIMNWWLTTVCIPYFRAQRQEEQHFVLILDNFLETSKDSWLKKDLPSWIHIIFLPPNLTSKHQPMDMGIIAVLKVAYKSQLLKLLLQVCDNAQLFKERQLISVPHGCRGVFYGHPPHILDAMQILQRIWSGDLANRYQWEQTIGRCWRKAHILPLLMQDVLNRDYGSRGEKHSFVHSSVEELVSAFQQFNEQVHTLQHTLQDSSIALPPEFSECLVENDTLEEISLDELKEALFDDCQVEEDPWIHEEYVAECIREEMRNDTEFLRSIQSPQMSAVSILTSSSVENKRPEMSRQQISSCLASMTDSLPHIGIPQDKLNVVYNMLTGITKIIDDTIRVKSKQTRINSFFQPSSTEASSANGK